MRKLKKKVLEIDKIPAVLYGDDSESLFLYVHGKGGYKEESYMLAKHAASKGHQVLAFDLPEHGDRKNLDYKCNVQNGVHDLEKIYHYIKDKWKNISLFASSLGAYFSLMAFQNIKFKKALFVSPVLDMEKLIKNMMKWSNVDEGILKEKKEISTEFGETLSWDYYLYVKENQIKKWNSKTYILYGAEDNLTEKKVIDSFTKKYDCCLEVMNNGEHFFHSDQQLKVLDEWISKILEII